MVLHLFISFLGGVPLCIPYGLYSGTSLGGTTQGILEGYPGRVLSEAIRKNPHYAINRGSLTEEAKVWFYFLSSVILPTKHLCAVREQEAIILYALLKGYKMNVGGLIEGSIRGYHLSNKRGLIPHPTTISRLCIFIGVRRSWDEEEMYLL